jgi:hypothetical protein
MPRTGRVVLAGYAHHIVQRGHNRRPVFAEARDYRRYLDTLREFKEGYAMRGLRILFNDQSCSPSSFSERLRGDREANEAACRKAGA